MQLKIKVPTIACDVCANTLTSAISALEPSAKIDIDIEKTSPEKRKSLP